VAAYTLVLELQDRWKVIPANCDYETADALFKSGQAAMIINGDWSWGDYLANPRIRRRGGAPARGQQHRPAHGPDGGHQGLQPERERGCRPGRPRHGLS
jgi:ABC-type glycerol-3-phosphate transport system substrate-binding protein